MSNATHLPTSFRSSSIATTRALRRATDSSVIAMETIEARVLLSGAPPVLTPEQPLPGDITPALSIGTQNSPALAEGPNGVSLAVWQDTRSGGNPYVPFGVGLGTMTDIYAARIRADASVIDVTPIPVSIETYNQFTPKVGWNGTNWLVAWDSPRSNDPYEGDINAVRISPEGVILDQQPIIVGVHAPNPNGSDDLDPIGPLEIVSDGIDWVVTYKRYNPSIAGGIGMEWFAVKVLAEGTTPNQAGVKILTADQYTDTYGFTFAPVNGGQYLHTFGTDGEVLARRYTTDLTSLSGVQNITGLNMGQRAAVAGGPSGWLFAWEYDLADWKKVMAQRISSTGTFSDTTPLQVTLDYEYAADVSLGATWNGVDWVVAYSGYGDNAGGGGQDIFARRIDPTIAGASAVKGGLINATPLPEHQSTPQLVSSGNGGFKMVYVDQQTSKPGISVVLVSPTNQVLVTNDASLAAPSQAGSRLATDGHNFLMVFGSTTAYGTRLLAQRVNPTGAALDQEPFVIADSSEKIRTYEVVYFNGGYVVLYSATNGPNGNQIYARTFGTDGTVGPARALVQNASGIGFALSDAAVNGDKLILVGNSAEGYLHQSFRFARIFNTSLQPTTSRFQIGSNFALGGDTEPVNGGWISA